MKKMKQLKKMISVMLAVIMSLAMMIPVMAAEETTPQTGSITINSGSGETGVSVAGKTFKAYRVLDATIATGAIKNEDGTTKDGFAYTVPQELEDFYATEFNLDKTASDFNAKVTDAISKIGNNDSVALEAFAKKVLDAAKKAGIEAVAKTGEQDATSVVIDNLPLGYYVVEDEGSATPLSALILDTTTPDASVNIKASQPVIDKEVNKNTSGTGEAEWSVSNNQAIGKPVEYKLTSRVPDMRGYLSYQFVMTDILSSGLTFAEDTAEMEIKIAGKDPEILTKGRLEEDGNVTGGDYALKVTSNVTEEGANKELSGTKIEIIFANFIQYRNLTNNAITVTYKATLNENAIIGVTGNDNDVKLTYSNKPGQSSEGQPDQPGPNDPIGETPWEKVKTYVTGIELFKIDGSTKAPLAGAKFKLEGTELATVVVDKVTFKEAAADFEGTKYWKLNDGSYTLTAPSTEEGATNEKYVKNEDGTYTVYERTTTREAVVTEETKTYEGTTDDTGVLAFDGLKAGTYKLTELVAPNGYNMLKDPIDIVITWKEPAEGSTECGWEYNGTTVGNRVEIPIENNTGTELPSTGGIGTTIFYIIGGILVVGAAILLVTKKRMSKEA